MNKNLQKKLFKKYPKIFVESKLPPNKSCMGQGITCGNGWYFLIDSLCNYIQCYIDAELKFNEKVIEQVVAKQVKEKMASLRFYYDGGDELIRLMVNYTMFLSSRTCEFCGTTDSKVKSTTKGKGFGWIRTVCLPCHKRWKKES